MTETKPRPEWIRRLYSFITDDIVDEALGYPMDGTDDDVLDAIELAVNNVLCEHYGHEFVDDMCMKPEHKYCVWCMRRIGDIDD